MPRHAENDKTATPKTHVCRRSYKVLREIDDDVSDSGRIIPDFWFCPKTNAQSDGVYIENGVKDEVVLRSPRDDNNDVRFAKVRSARRDILPQPMSTGNVVVTILI